MNGILNATSTCTILTASTSECIYQYNTTDILSFIGSLNFGIAIILVMLFVTFASYIFNSFKSKKY